MYIFWDHERSTGTEQKLHGITDWFKSLVCEGALTDKLSIMTAADAADDS